MVLINVVFPDSPVPDKLMIKYKYHEYSFIFQKTLKTDYCKYLNLIKIDIGLYVYLFVYLVPNAQKGKAIE